MFVFGSWLADFVAAIAVLFTIVYFWVTYPYDYWKKRNVPYIKPSFPFGNFGRQITGKVLFTQMFEEFYPELKRHGYCGLFNMREPVLIVVKPDLIKQILTKDFNSFHDRGFTPDEENDPLSANLFNLGGARWKALRAKLSPTFTSGKIKGMFPLIQEVAEELKGCIRVEMKKNNGSVDLRDLLVRYTTDVIGTCAFGIRCNSLKDPKSEFHEMGRSITKLTASNKIMFLLITLFPKLRKVITFRVIFSKATDFFVKLMERTTKYRKENNVERNDFVQLMMKILDEETDRTTFNQDIMTAQAFLFFLAGLDNVANNIGFCLHALALDTGLQDRVYNEIETVLRDHGGQLSYESLKKMDLVSRVIDEGLRMYAPAGFLMRAVTQDNYVIPGTNIELEKGTKVTIPIQSVFNDEEYFPNPRKFDPDRHTEEEKAKRHSYAYIPFGEGPRFCIAERFAQLEMRLCFVELLRQFRFSVAPETDVSLTLELKAIFGPTPKKGFWLRITERNAAE